MRWCFTHQHPSMFEYHAVAVLWGMLCSIGSVFLIVLHELLRWGSTLKGRLINSGEFSIFFEKIVKSFTMFGRITLVEYTPHQIDTISYSQNVPRRTIRRVHVMPWATPIRRIGRLRMQHIGRENDDPANLCKMLMRLGHLVLID